MVRQNPTNKGVTAKIVFLNGLWLNAKPRWLPGLFLNSMYLVYRIEPNLNANSISFCLRELGGFGA